MRPAKNTAEIENAKSVAREYCRKNGLDIASLETQKVFQIGEVILFAQPIMGNGLGLQEDISTQPKPTLILRKTDHGYMIDQTEYTNRYLSLAH